MGDTVNDMSNMGRSMGAMRNGELPLFGAKTRALKQGMMQELLTGRTRLV